MNLPDNEKSSPQNQWQVINLNPAENERSSDSVNVTEGSISSYSMA